MFFIVGLTTKNYLPIISNSPYKEEIFGINKARRYKQLIESMFEDEDPYLSNRYSYLFNPKDRTVNFCLTEGQIYSSPKIHKLFLDSGKYSAISQLPLEKYLVEKIVKLKPVLQKSNYIIEISIDKVKLAQDWIKKYEMDISRT